MAKLGRRSAAALCTLTLVLRCGAQDIAPELQPLRHGPIVVWIIGPAVTPVKLASNYAITPPTPMTYHEQTSGSFGQNASNFGQNAGSYGLPSDTSAISTKQSAPGEDAPAPAADGSGYHQQTSGSFGQTASSYGTAASNHGQTAGSFGQTASSTGTNAGNYGQTVGSFGNSLGTIAGAGTPVAKPVASHAQEAFAEALRRAFPELQAKYVDVASNELKDRLAAAAGTADAPDVLVGALPDSWGAELRSQYVVEMLLPPGLPIDGMQNEDRSSMAAISILLRAPHRDAARALALWSSEADSGCAGCVAKTQPLYAGIAMNAMARVLHGAVMGDLADLEMARLGPAVGQRVLTTVADTVADASAARVELVRSSINGGGNGRLAVVSLRVVVASDKVFGVVHPLVVLRKANDGQWRVLQVSLNLQAFDAEKIRQALMSTSPNATREQSAGVMGVKLALPADGDARPLVPELSWDNGGGAGLQVVEWQRANGDKWSDSRLYLVPDQGARLKTHVTAEFADRQGHYQWRVWSIGAQGAMKISPWRMLTIVP